MSPKLEDLRDRFALVQSTSPCRTGSRESTVDDGTGIYAVTKESHVTADVAAGSTSVAVLLPGARVRIVAIAISGRLVRGKVADPAGWTTLQDITEGLRWANRETRIACSPLLSSTRNWGNTGTVRSRSRSRSTHAASNPRFDIDFIVAAVRDSSEATAAANRTPSEGPGERADPINLASLMATLTQMAPPPATIWG